MSRRAAVSSFKAQSTCLSSPTSPLLRRPPRPAPCRAPPRPCPRKLFQVIAALDGPTKHCHPDGGPTWLLAGRCCRTLYKCNLILSMAAAGPCQEADRGRGWERGRFVMGWSVASLFKSCNNARADPDKGGRPEKRGSDRANILLRCVHDIIGASRGHCPPVPATICGPSRSRGSPAQTARRSAHAAGTCRRSYQRKSTNGAPPLRRGQRRTGKRPSHTPPEVCAEAWSEVAGAN